MARSSKSMTDGGPRTPVEHTYTVTHTRTRTRTHTHARTHIHTHTHTHTEKRTDIRRSPKQWLVEIIVDRGRVSQDSLSPCFSTPKVLRPTEAAVNRSIGLKLDFSWMSVVDADHLFSISFTGAHCVASLEWFYARSHQTN